jgi:hypothetical protein
MPRLRRSRLADFACELFEDVGDREIARQHVVLRDPGRGFRPLKVLRPEWREPRFKPLITHPAAGDGYGFSPTRRLLLHPSRERGRVAERCRLRQHDALNVSIKLSLEWLRRGSFLMGLSSLV